MADEEPKQMTLLDFVEGHQRLLTVLGVFMALSVFMRTVSPSAKNSLYFITLALALLVWLEIALRIPYRGVHWRLEAFRWLFLYGLYEFAAYSLSIFPGRWPIVLSIGLTFALFVGLNRALMPRVARATAGRRVLGAICLWGGMYAILLLSGVVVGLAMIPISRFLNFVVEVVGARGA